VRQNGAALNVGNFPENTNINDAGNLVADGTFVSEFGMPYVLDAYLVTRKMLRIFRYLDPVTPWGA
jgi:DhnA family fructose-bisphosphate aldolase class Ia